MIRVFSRKTKATPVDDKVYNCGPPLWALEDRDVAVSCTFTYDKPRAEYLAMMWTKQGYDVKVGGPAYDDKGGNFIPGKFLKPGYVITSRGCNNNCWFCSTWKREGKIRELPIVDGFNVLDSNLLQCSRKHIKAVFAMLKQQKQKAIFTGGLEAAKLKSWHVDLLDDLKPQRIFFAYDTPDDYEPLRGAAMVTNGLCGKHDRMCYVLIGYPDDTMEKAEDRLLQVFDLGLTPMAMLYRDDKGKTKQEWRQFQRQWARPHIIYGKLKG